MNLLRRKRKMIMERKRKKMRRRKSNGMKKERMRWMILMILMECILMIGLLWLRGLKPNSCSWS